MSIGGIIVVIALAMTVLKNPIRKTEPLLLFS